MTKCDDDAAAYGIMHAEMATDSPLTAEQIKQQVEYWLDLAEYDMETARAMLISRRLLYVAFMCHQALEKALKGVYAVRCQAVPPKMHSLVKLAQLSGIWEEMTEDQQEWMIAVQPMNIESRYPAEKAKLLASLTVAECEQMNIEAAGMLQWIKQKLLNA